MELIKWNWTIESEKWKAVVVFDFGRSVHGWFLVSIWGLLSETGRHYALEEAAKAQEWMESRQSIGKIILDVPQ
ncbi:hypothetical protein [Sporolactobacillus pectinivorans]|uniref:hypothetical protein n=1 Tax=Sporolactobacillus pectinivorans TaxID=1591408 RepID=UPI001EFEBFB9|nr:hypothetical protein [Sporolactobacillus pectinivorans]